MVLYKTINKRKRLSGRAAASKMRQYQLTRGVGKSYFSPAVEYNTYFILQADYTTTAAVQYAPIHTPAVGTSYNNRIGDRSLIKKINIRFTVLPTATETVPNDVRVFLLWDKQPNNAAPGSPLPLLEAKPYATMDPEYINRFTVLKDATYTTGPDAAATGQVMAQHQRSKPIQWKLNCNLECFHTANGQAITDIATGALLFCFVSTTAGVVFPKIRMASETKFFP